MTTPHIGAGIGEIAEIVLMPGDPLRAKFIAENYFSEVVCVNQVRNMLGFTGYYNGERISVMSSGMGMPSMAIYATELFQVFGVQKLIRVGSCGSIHPDVNLGDLVVAMGASTDSNMNRVQFAGLDFAAIADYTMLKKWADVAEVRGVNFSVANVLTSDTFYQLNNDVYDIASRFGIVAVEMEVAALYRISAEYGRKALGVMTVSDHITKNERLSAEEREKNFGEMIEITLSSL